MCERSVIDTNTIVSAALFRHSVPCQAVDTALACGMVLVSEATTFDLTDVLLRSKFDRLEARQITEIVRGDTGEPEEGSAFNPNLMQDDVGRGS